MADERTEVDFVRYVGARVVDEGNDERSCKIVDGSCNLGLRPDASLLAISNRHGVIFSGTSDGFRWAWLADVRSACASGIAPDVAADQFVDGATAIGAPMLLSLNCEDACLAVCTERTIMLYDVADTLRGGCVASPRARAYV